jgi:hypothetical protein
MILICPDTPPAPQTLGHAQPAALVSLFGVPLLEHFLIYFADQGIRQFDIIVSDRPEAVRHFVGDGVKWGVTIRIHARKSEPTLNDDFSSFAADPHTNPPRAVRVDHLPWLTELHEMGSEEWFKHCLQNPPPAKTLRPDYAEWGPSIFVAKQSPVPPGTDIKPPCYIGSKVRIGNDCSIGPNVIIGDDVFLDDGCEVRNSLIGSSTYIGPDLTLDRSMVMNDWVMDWSIGTDHRVSDPLLLRGNHVPAHAPGMLSRLAAFIGLIVLSPLMVIAFVRSIMTGKSWIAGKNSAATSHFSRKKGMNTLRYYELPSFSGYARRYPQLWNIVKGQFRWVGNRPINHDQSKTLLSEYEQMWLHAAYGLFSLADLHGVADSFSDEEKVHSSYYAATQSKKSDMDILWRCLASKR